MLANWRLAVVFLAVVIGIAAGLGLTFGVGQLLPKDSLAAYHGIIAILLVLACCGAGAFGLGYLAIKWEYWSRQREKRKRADRRKPGLKKKAKGRK